MLNLSFCYFSVWFEANEFLPLCGLVYFGD